MIYNIYIYILYIIYIYGGFYFVSLSNLVHGCHHGKVFKLLPLDPARNLVQNAGIVTSRAEKNNCLK